MVESFPSQNQSPEIPVHTRRVFLRLLGTGLVGLGSLTVYNSHTRIRAYEEQSRLTAESVCFKAIAPGTSQEVMKVAVQDTSIRNCLTILQGMYQKDIEPIIMIHNKLRWVGSGMVAVGLATFLAANSDK